MNKSGHADLPLHNGRVPYWLAQRMAKLGGAITESIVMEYGIDAFMAKLSDPLWFQSFGCVLGMDWHSSGITTSVMGALKKALNPVAHDLGIYVCGGRGKHSLKTPQELISLADRTGLDGKKLVQSSKLSAKIDNTAVQDGYTIYLHNFIVTKAGHWAVIQQGMNTLNGMARRYHWYSKVMSSFIKEPHAAVCGQNKGLILNLTAEEALETQQGILNLTSENPETLLTEARRILMPRHHNVRSRDVDLKRLGSILALAHEKKVSSFDELLLIRGLGPRTIQSLTLVSEVIHGTHSRFSDPARFSFAHGGKDGHPFPVPLKVYDQTINILKTSVEKARIGLSDKRTALKDLHRAAVRIEQDFSPVKKNFDEIIKEEKKHSYRYGGMTAAGPSKPPNEQLSLF
ncbi:DUF763 domain-containing protein [Fulvivirga sp. M361]|uniref:DUF763 domain-containing protein n=1 Tax=Fulvivirga sp. M361 TaxID=2594266 RepID=UPI00117B8B0F|nr:DUF763 domain-containing protein [Fulvivirga sp. M361]TRX59586.1 DUF763 domain-containing protein [Fulvivirga sp. M361]